jgi:acyl carrier protein
VTSGGADLTGEIRLLLAEITRDSAALEAPDGTALLRDGIGLDSLGGTVLLTEIKRRYGIDIADEDLNLDSLASIGALASYVQARMAAQGSPR